MLHNRLAPTGGAIAGSVGRSITAATLLASLIAAATLSTLVVAGTAGADQVSGLKSQAEKISQELIQEQLQVGAYQQQYSVASQKVAVDSQDIALTEQQINSDMRQVKAKEHQVRQLAISSYVFDGNQSATSSGSIFSDHESTAQATSEYTTIVVGNIAKAVAQLHTAQHTLVVHQSALQQQQAQDRSAENEQASDLSQANSTEAQLNSDQSQVTGQLAVAVAQEAAAQTAAATQAVAAAQKQAVAPSPSSQPTSSASPPTTPAPVNGATTDPALNPFLQCVVQAESGGNYGAVSPNGLYMGAFQFSQPTWNYAAQSAGLPQLVGVPPNTASKADQDTVAVALYALDGEQPWLGDRCSQ